MTTEVVLCGECNEPAVARYRWPWGDEGTCCATHQFLLNQKAGNLSQTCQFSPINPPLPPLGRDERTQLHAARLAAEDELREVQARGRQLHEQCEKRGAELIAKHARVQTLEGLVKATEERLARVELERDEALSKLASTTDELELVKGLLPKEETL
jgi:hypothetical protein